MAEGDIRILESFDRYAETGSIGRMDSVWSVNLSLVAGRYFGGKGVRFAGSGNNGSAHYTYINQRIHRWTIGCAIFPESRVDNTLLAAIGPSGSITLGYSTTGRLVVVRGAYGNFRYVAGDLLGEGNRVDAIVQNVWHYVEFQVTQVGNVGDVKAWVNGELCLDVTGVAINRSGGFDGFGIARSAIDGQAVYDDFYVREGGTRLGEIKIESIVPDGTLSNTLPVLVGNATAHGAVSESPVDGDASYVSGDTAGQGVRFTMGNLTDVPNAIRAVQLRSYARKDETAYRSIKNVIKVNAVEAQGSEQVLSTGYKFFRDIFPLNPETGIAWTKAAIDGFACGIDIEA